MIAQRREVLAGDQGIVGSWVQVSDDHGRTWEEIGPMDRAHEHAVMSARNVVTSDRIRYAGVWSRFGSSLYVSAASPALRGAEQLL